MENTNKLLPLGSLVLVKGTVKKVMIIARGLAVNEKEGLKVYDYGAVTYPEGMIGENILNFDREAVEEVLHEGYADEEEERMTANLEEWLRKTREQSMKAGGMS